MDAELEFAIQPSTTGKQLFDQVSTSDTRETQICTLKTTDYNRHALLLSLNLKLHT